MFRLIKFVVFLIVIAGVLYLGQGFFLNRAGKYLLRKDNLKPADVIVILSGEEKERVQYGLKLFKEDWAKKNRIVMSGGPAVGNYSWAGLMKEYAGHLGVPEKFILTEDRSRSTEENAVFTRELLKTHGYKSIILVTSPYHSKRASIIFRDVLGPGFKIINAPVEDSWFRFDEWWKRSRDRDTVLSEFSKFIRIWIFGVNKGGPADSAEE